MTRINILGNSGSGKSTLARAIGEQLNSPVIHLDRLFWEPGWREADPRVFRRRVARAVGGDAWVCEGNYAAKTFDLRLARADLTIWLNTPRLTCAARVIRRSTGIKVRPDLPVGCKEGHLKNTIDLVRDIMQFDAVRRPRIEAELARWITAGSVLHLKDRRQIAAFLTSLQRPAG